MQQVNQAKLSTIIDELENDGLIEETRLTVSEATSRLADWDRNEQTIPVTMLFKKYKELSKLVLEPTAWDAFFIQYPIMKLSFMTSYYHTTKEICEQARNAECNRIVMFSLDEE